MSTITSTGSGPWATGGTWVGGVAPGDGDRAIIATGHTVTLDANQVVGDSPASATDWVLDIVGTGVLDLAGYQFTAKGPIRLGIGSTSSRDRIIGTAGSKLYLDGSATPGTTYLIQFGTGLTSYYNRAGIKLDGTSGTHCELKCIGGSAKMYRAEIYNSRSLYLTYTDISGFGSATVDAFTMDSNFTTGDTADTSGVHLDHCAISNCGHFRIAARATNPYIYYSKWTSSLQNFANGYQSLQINSTLAAGSGTLVGCSFDRQLALAGTSSAGWTVSDLTVRAGFWLTSTAPPTAGVNRILYYLDDATDTAISTSSGCKLNGNWSNIYLAVDFTGNGASGNPHQLNIYNAANTFALDTVISDYRAVRFNTDTGDTLDAFGVSVSSSVTRALILPAVFSDGTSQKDASGAMWFGTATANAKITFSHCTIYSPTATTGIKYPHGTSVAANTGAVRSCLFWADAVNSNYSVEWDYSVNHDDMLALADGLQNNAHWNMATGTNSVASTPTNYLGYNANQWSAAPTLTDVTLSAAPGFVDSTRNMWTWASTVLGLTGTDAELRDGAIAAIEADRTLLTAADTGLIPWVMAGYAPTNSELQNAGHDGATIGAVAYVALAAATRRGRVTPTRGGR